MARSAAAMASDQLVASGIRDTEGTRWVGTLEPRVRIAREPRGFEGEIAAFKLSADVLILEGSPTRPTPSLPADRFRFGADGSVWHHKPAWPPDKWKRTSTWWSTNGSRLELRLRIGGRSTSLGVGALILEAFGQPRPPKHICAYKDGDKTNLALTNLEWIPIHSLLRGHSNPAVAGERHRSSILTAAQVRQARELHKEKGIPSTALAKQLGVSNNAMRSALKGITWRDAGGPISYDKIQSFRAAARGRPGTKLTPRDVAQVRRWIAAGMTDVEIAGRKGVSPTAIRDIRRDRKWKS